MAYPSIEQYQEALQYPGTAFTDPLLAGGLIDTTGLGLPLVASGGFALTYAVKASGTKYAVRCFHKEAKGLERRYEAISRKLKALANSYFVDFQYQAQGVKANKGVYPVVKMAWASGKTLGDFVETHHADRTQLTGLMASLQQLAAYLEQQGIAHGDIQEGNLMVADGGRRLQLIDYDGMYVPEIESLGSSELGHRDYQHPKRSPTNYDAKLDRFSLIALNLALRALCERPALWASSQSGAGVILLRANDYAAPETSQVLADIAKIPALARDAKNFIAICAGRFSEIPSLAQFLAGANIPSYAAPISTAAPRQDIGYISQYPVLDGSDYGAFAKRIGQMVELVGRVIDVSVQRTKKEKKPYVFVNFGNWKGQCVKIALWSEALAKANGNEWPSVAWVGRWITIRGLVQPVYRGGTRGAKTPYEHISIAASAISQISQLSEAQARYRLAGPSTKSPPPTASNTALLQQMRTGTSTRNPRGIAVPSPARTTAPPAPLSSNQQALQKLRQQSRGTQPAATGRPQATRPPSPAANRPTGLLGWILRLFQ